MMVVRDNSKFRLQVDQLSCEDIKRRITSLTSLVKAANKDLIVVEDLYYVMTILEDHLPSEEILRE